MKVFSVKNSNLPMIKEWLTENLSAEGVRWWVIDGVISPFNDDYYTDLINDLRQNGPGSRLFLDVTEEEEPKLSWFILMHG